MSRYGRVASDTDELRGAQTVDADKRLYFSVVRRPEALRRSSTASNNIVYCSDDELVRPSVGARPGAAGAARGCLPIAPQDWLPRGTARDALFAACTPAPRAARRVTLYYAPIGAIARVSGAARRAGAALGCAKPLRPPFQLGSVPCPSRPPRNSSRAGGSVGATRGALSLPRPRARNGSRAM